MIKRILSGLLALQMLVSILPVPSFAQDEAVLCETCAQEVCVCETVQTCETCGQENCESQHLTWCEVCRKDDCGVDHNTPAPLSDPAPIAEDNCPYCEDAVDADGNTTHEDTCNTRFSVDASSHVGKTAVFSMMYLDGFYTDAEPYEGMDYDALQEADYDLDDPPLVKITDWHWDVSGPALWYRVAPLSGESLPSGITTESWILQNYTNESDTYSNTLNFVNASMLNKTVAFSNATAFLYDGIEREYKKVVDITKLTEMVVKDIFYYEYEMYYVDSDNWPAEYDGYHYVRADMVKEVEVVGPKCDVCGQPGCTRLHFYCERCNGYDCGKSHLVCPACEGKVVDCKLTHVWCGYCGDYDCGQEHEPMVPVTAPVIPENVELAEGQDVTLADEFGQAVTGEEGIVLIPGTKVSLSAWAQMVATDDVSYQWQICYDMEEDLWVSIQGHTEKGILVSQGMVQSLLEENEATALRCQVTVNGKTMTSTPIPVTMAEEPASFNLSSGASSSDASSQAEADNLTKVHVVINYLFGNNTIAANPWIAELSAGSSISDKIKLPVVMGYLPTFANTDNATLIQENNTYFLQINYSGGVAADTTLNVVYQPANVPVKVLHYRQNKADNEYTLFETENLTLETDSLVGDVHKTYEGFFNLLYEHPTVAANGSTVVEVYYDRYYYLMKFDLDGGYGVDPIYARYGAEISVGEPSRSGYKFGGWLLNGVSEEIPDEMPPENRTYKANWTEPQTVNYTVVYWRENADDTNYSIWGSETKKAIAGTTVSGSDSVPTTISNAVVNGNNVNEKQYFTYNAARTDKDVVVKGDGSTTIHVYYTRNYYTLYFKGFSGKCVLEAHNHNDGSCVKQLLCHAHDASCEQKVTCTIPAHTHTGECCTLQEHEHTDACYTCKEHTAHVRECYKFSGNASISNTAVNNTDTIKKLNGQQPDANGIVTDKKNRYVKLGNSWYQINNYNNKDTTVTLTCGGIHSHGAGNCTYKDTVHTHDVGNCICTQDVHEHVADCYEWICPDTHTHTNACYGSCIKYVHAHTYNCNYNSTSNIVYVIHKKYNASISDIWPTAAMFPGLAYWTGTGVSYQSSKLLNMVPAICVAGGNTFTAHTDTTAYQLNYMFESFDQTSPANGTTRVYWGNKYYDLSKEYSQISYYDNDQDTWGYKDISGLSAASESSARNDGNNTFWLYYNRNRNVINFKNTSTGSDQDTIIKQVPNVMYGQPLANYIVDDKLLSTTVPGKDQYPAGLEAGAYEFAGWYTTPEGYAGTEFDFNTATMPDGVLDLYAKWIPITHIVKFYLDKTQYEAGVTIPEQLGPSYERFNDMTVSHGYMIGSIDDPGVAPGDADHPYEGYTFTDWFYLDDAGKEQAFIIGESGMPVNDNLHLYAKWSSNVLRGYTVYFALDANKDGVADVGEDGKPIYVADPVTGSTLAGNSRTIHAKGDTDLYVGYQAGYYPDAVSHTLTMNVADPDNQGANTHTFLYTPQPPIPYTVKYLIKGSQEPVPGTTEKRVEGNMKAIVTEFFVPVTGYMPDAYQKTLIITPEGENVIIFEYTRDEVHALYQINHYIQSVDGTAWTEYKSETITGDIHEVYSAAPIAINGFTFSSEITDDFNTVKKINGYTSDTLPCTVSTVTGADNAISGTLTSNGMQLNLYYTRNQYPYHIYFQDGATGKDLLAPIKGSQYYGALVSHTAQSVITSTDEGFEFELYDTEPETKSMTIRVDEEGDDGRVTLNKIVFYYTRCTQNLTITKTVVGEVPDPNQIFNFTVTIDEDYSFHQSEYETSTGTNLQPTLDGVISFSLKAGESITIQDLPTAEYTIAEIVPDSADYIADIDSITSGDQSSVYIVLTKDSEVEVTCVNKYPPKTGTLTIHKTVTGNVPSDENQYFIFHISGTADNDTKVDMDVTIPGSGSITISDLPLGTYTVTEDTSWSWRYQCTDGASKEVAISSASLQGSAEFTNRYEENKWLNFSTVMNNLFACQAEGDDES